MCMRVYIYIYIYIYIYFQVNFSLQVTRQGPNDLAHAGWTQGTALRTEDYGDGRCSGAACDTANHS